MTRDRVTKASVSDDGKLHFYDQDGREVFPAVHPIHPLRWKFMGLWIAVFSTVSILGYHSNRGAINELHKQKATVNQLATTNHALKSFLLQACKARLNSASHETGEKRAQDIASAEGYKNLAVLFKGPDNPKCNVPKRGS